MVTPGSTRFTGTTQFSQSEEPGPESAPNTGPAAAQKLGQQFEELREYAAYYAAAKADALKLKITQALVWAALGVVGLLTLVALICTATAVLIMGIAAGLAQRFDNDLSWLGGVITGLSLLVIVAVATIVAMRSLSGASRTRILKKYARRRQEQKQRFGHDVGDRAH